MELEHYFSFCCLIWQKSWISFRTLNYRHWFMNTRENWPLSWLSGLLLASLPSGACRVSGFICSIGDLSGQVFCLFAFHTCTGKMVIATKTWRYFQCLDYFASKLCLVCDPPSPATCATAILTSLKAAQALELTLAGLQLQNPGVAVYCPGAGNFWPLEGLFCLLFAENRSKWSCNVHLEVLHNDCLSICLWSISFQPCPDLANLGVGLE